MKADKKIMKYEDEEKNKRYYSKSKIGNKTCE